MSTRQKDQFLKLRVEQECLEAVDLLVEATRMNRSVVLRELIPTTSTAKALVEFQKMTDWQYDQGDGFQRSSVMNIERYFISSGLSLRMQKDHEHPIPLQVELMGSGDDPHVKVACLFSVWAKAKRGEGGYRFEKVSFRGDPRWEIAVGPGDSPEKIRAFASRMCDFAEKIGM